MKNREASHARSTLGNVMLCCLISLATLGCTLLQPPGAAPQRTATPGGVTAASPAPAAAPATSPVYGAAAPTPAPATGAATPAVPATPAPAPAPVPVPVPVLGFDEALQAAANALFTSARLPTDAPPPAALVIDPLIDGMSGEQSAATRTMEARIVEIGRASCRDRVCT